MGATSNLLRRMFQHKTKFYKGSFSARYNYEKLVYFEEFQTMKEAFERERQLKKGNRKRKMELINKGNLGWNDLSEGWIFNV